MPFCSCTHTTGLSNCSDERGHCVSAAQGQEVTAGFCPALLGAGKEEGNAAGAPGYSSFACREHCTSRPKGSSVAETILAIPACVPAWLLCSCSEELPVQQQGKGPQAK